MRKRLLLLSVVFCMAIVPALAITQEQVRTYVANHTTEWVNTPYCNVGCEGGLAINFSDIPTSFCPIEVDLKQKLKARYYDYETWQELDLTGQQFWFWALLRNGQLTERYRFHEIPDSVDLCKLDTLYTLVTWDRTPEYSDTTVEWIKELFGHNFTEYDTWSPTTLTIDLPSDGGIVHGNIDIHATVEDSNLNHAYWYISNSTYTSPLYEFIGHNETFGVTNSSPTSAGIYQVDGRDVVNGSSSTVTINSEDTMVWDGDSTGDDKWGRRNSDDVPGDHYWWCWTRDPYVEDCGVANITIEGFLDDKCSSVWGYSWSSAGWQKINLTVDDGQTWVTHGGEYLTQWYFQQDDVDLYDADSDGEYEMRIAWYNDTGGWAGKDSGFGGIKCVPDQSIFPNFTYLGFDTTTLADGTYNITLNATNSTGATNTTQYISITIDNNAPTCTINYPPDFTGVCGSNSCGYVDTTGIVGNVTCTDAGSGISSVNVMWSGTSTYGNYTTIQDTAGNYYNITDLASDDYTFYWFATDVAGAMNSGSTSASLKWYGLTSDQNSTLYGIGGAEDEPLQSDIWVTYILMASIFICYLAYGYLYNTPSDTPLPILMSMFLSLALVFKSYSVVMTTDLDIIYYPMPWVGIFGGVLFWVSVGLLLLDFISRIKPGPISRKY